MIATGGTPVGQKPRTLKVDITCVEEAQNEAIPTFVNEDEVNFEYQFTWKHNAACGAGCQHGGGPGPSGPTGSSSSLSVGSYMLILYVCVRDCLCFVGV